jgi:predicted metalloprotease
MRLGDYRSSDNVGDQRGQSFGGGGFGGGGLPGMLIGLVASRFGIGGVLILLLGYCALSTLGGGGGSGIAPQKAAQSGANPAQSCAVDAASRFSCQVLANTEDTWKALFAKQGKSYTPAGFIFYGGQGRAAGGRAPSGVGRL